MHLFIYVDNMLIDSKNKEENRLKAELNKDFEMKNPGRAKKILCMEIMKTERETYYV